MGHLHIRVWTFSHGAPTQTVPSVWNTLSCSLKKHNIHRLRLSCKVSSAGAPSPLSDPCSFNRDWNGLWLSFLGNTSKKKRNYLCVWLPWVLWLEGCLLHCAGSFTVALGLWQLQRRLGCSRTCGTLVHLPGMEPVSPALQGRFLNTRPLGKSWKHLTFDEIGKNEHELKDFSLLAHSKGHSLQMYMQMSINEIVATHKMCNYSFSFLFLGDWLQMGDLCWHTE